MTFAPFGEDYNICIKKGKSVMVFNPITERIRVVGDLDITPTSPITAHTFHSSTDAGLYYWAKVGGLKCHDLKTLELVWNLNYRKPYSGGSLISYKEHLISGGPKAERLCFIDKQEGSIEHSVPFRGESVLLTVDGGELFALNRAGRLLGLSLARGHKEKWRIDFKNVRPSAAPVVGGNRVYVLTEQGNCYCIHKRNGTQEWRADVADKPLKGGGFLKNSIYIYDSSGTIYRLDSKGAVKDRLYGKGPIAAGFVLYNDSLLFISDRGELVVYAQ
jgi:hypothetical protein